MNEWNSDQIRIRDPYVVTDREQGRYLLFGTTDTDPWEGAGEGFQVYESRDLTTWQGPRWAFRRDGSFWAEKNYWAPEAHFYNGSWYLFASFKAEGKFRGTQILKADRAEGPYAPITDGPVTPCSWECLDGTLHVDEQGRPWIVFCHEWIQIGNGTVCAMPLSDDLREGIGEPEVLFHAADAPWAVAIDGDGRCFVTDGPFLYRGADGSLRMIWSSFSKKGYAVGIAVSRTGSVLGPWDQLPEPVLEGGGHGMIFEELSGASRLIFHSPNESPLERLQSVPFEK